MANSIRSNVRSSLTLQEEILKYKFKHQAEYDSIQQIKLSKILREGNKRVIKNHITHQHMFEHYAYMDFSYVRLPIKNQILNVSYKKVESIELGDIFETLKHTNLQYMYDSKQFFQRMFNSLDWYGHTKNRKRRIKELC